MISKEKTQDELDDFYKNFKTGTRPSEIDHAKVHPSHEIGIQPKFAFNSFLRDKLEELHLSSLKMNDEFRLFMNFVTDVSEQPEKPKMTIDLETRFNLIMNQSKELSAEHKKADQELLKIIEIVSLFDENYSKLTKLLESKRQFIGYMTKIRDRNGQLLQNIYDRLNQVEDDYAIIESAISKLKKAHEQNIDEIESIERQTEFITHQKLAAEKEVQTLETKMQMSQEALKIKTAELDSLNSRIEQIRTEADQKNVELELVQNKFFLEGFDLYEQKEKLAYLEETINRLIMDTQNLQRTKEKHRFEIVAKVAALEEVLKQRDSEVEQADKVERLLRNLQQEIVNEGVTVIDITKAIR